MSLGICMGCKKRRELNTLGYCNTGSCSAESAGFNIGSKLFKMLENWASKYFSQTTFKIIFGGLITLVFLIYFVLNN